jgi:hypothetical protein
MLVLWAGIRKCGPLEEAKLYCNVIVKILETFFSHCKGHRAWVFNATVVDARGIKPTHYKPIGLWVRCERDAFVDAFLDDLVCFNLEC